MRVTDMIAAKRDGAELAVEDVARLVLEFARGDVPDYQMSAFLMAVCLRGLSFAETTAMTRAMIQSGTTLDLSSIPGIKVDKHSTGGVGDKTTLVVVPLLAACGLKVPKMSGRGLGFTGGTLDKLESIPHFDTALSVERFVAQVRETGAAIAGQTPEIVPADKKIYALRDVTATVECLPLIAASIMSKKIACSADVILLDVKFGTGAFMRSVEKARELARIMIAIGSGLGRRVGAAITDMNQPLGGAVGNALEVKEALECLRGGGPDDLRSLCVELAGQTLHLSGQGDSAEAGRARALDSLDSGAALSKFAEIVSAQGGDSRVIDDPDLLPEARLNVDVACSGSGRVTRIDCARIGGAARVLGAGRERKEDMIDPAVGVVVLKKLGDAVEPGEPVALVHANDSSLAAEAVAMIAGAYELGGDVVRRQLVQDMIY